jgi:hypothetical protein
MGNEMFQEISRNTDLITILEWNIDASDREKKMFVLIKEYIKNRSQYCKLQEIPS